MTPFPTDPAERKAAAAAMTAASPALMQDVAAWRQLFPKARLTHFKAGDMEYGEGGKDGFVITEAFCRAALEVEARRNQPPVTTTKRRRR